MEEVLDGLLLIIEHQCGHVIVVLIEAGRLVSIAIVDTWSWAEVAPNIISKVLSPVARQQGNTCAQECGEHEHKECGDNGNQESFHDPEGRGIIVMFFVSYYNEHVL